LCLPGRLQLVSDSREFIPVVMRVAPRMLPHVERAIARWRTRWNAHQTFRLSQIHTLSPTAASNLEKDEKELKKDLSYLTKMHEQFVKVLTELQHAWQAAFPPSTTATTAVAATSTPAATSAKSDAPVGTSASPAPITTTPTAVPLVLNSGSVDLMCSTYLELVRLIGPKRQAEQTEARFRELESKLQLQHRPLQSTSTAVAASSTATALSLTQQRERAEREAAAQLGEALPATLELLQPDFKPTADTATTPATATAGVGGTGGTDAAANNPTAQTAAAAVLSAVVTQPSAVSEPSDAKAGTTGVTPLQLPSAGTADDDDGTDAGDESGVDIADDPIAVGHSQPTH
jgi:hypothetical protein